MSDSNLEFIDKKEIDERDLEIYYEQLKQINHSMDKLDPKQTSLNVRINSEKPIGVALWGDWHIGSRGVDYDRLDEDTDLICKTPSLYTIEMGDYKDNQNALVHASGVQEDIAPSEFQDSLVRRVFKKIGKTKRGIGAIRGCHDDWDHRLSDKDFIQVLCEDANCANLWHGGVISIELGDQIYSIFARHKYKNESGLNTTNAQRNIINDKGYFDIVAIAHKHFYDMHMTPRMGKDTVYIRSGSYKYYDEHGQKLAGYKGIYGVPVVILYPDKHRVQPIRYLDMACELLDKL